MFVTFTGKKFDYNNIEKGSICIEDIFHSLSRINRFIGHSKRPYTVAEHLLRCLDMANDLGYTPRLKLLVFVHDFAEAYTGDCPTPLKDLLLEFKRIEKDVEQAVYEHLNIEPPTEEEHLLIKRIDNTMLVLEMRDLTLHDHTVYINDLTYIEQVECGNYDIVADLDLSEHGLQHFLNEGLQVLKDELGMKRFNIFVGDKDIMGVVEIVELYCQEDADTYAQQVAYDSYFMNPPKDVLEIMKEEGVSEEKANEIFHKRMRETVKYLAEEIVE